mgnify:CR=1 FL=1
MGSEMYIRDKSLGCIGARQRSKQQNTQTRAVFFLSVYFVFLRRNKIIKNEYVFEMFVLLEVSPIGLAPRHPNNMNIENV